MRRNKYGINKSISNRVKYTFMISFILIISGSLFSIYVRDLTTKKYDEYMNINIKLGKLSVEISNSWDYNDLYMKNKDTDSLQKYNASNDKIKSIMQEIAPFVNNDINGSIYFRNLSNMFEDYKTRSDYLMMKSKLDESDYTKLQELKTLSTYISKHSELLMLSYLNYSDNQYTQSLIKSKTSEIQIYITLLFTMLLSFTYAMFLSRDLKITLGKVRGYALELSKGNWDISDLKDQKYTELNSLAQVFNKMKHSIKDFIEELNRKAEIENSYNLEKLRSTEKDKLIKESQLLALQSQMDPHFLFNTLNTISRMAMFEGADQTTKLIEATSKILRYNLDYKEKRVKLKEEIKMIRAYVTIQETRFLDQMSFVFEIDPCLDDNILIPPMLIQPIIENAIVHGLKEKVSGGIIHITIRQQDKFTAITIKDNGTGIDHEKVALILSSEYNTTNHLGLFNVKRRLELYFNRSDLIKVYSKAGEGTEITIYIPIEGVD